MSLQRELQLELPLRRTSPAAPAARRHPRQPKAFAVERWQDGTPLPFLGRKITLCLDAHCDRAELAGEALRLPLPPAAAETQIKDRAEAWLQAEARRALEALLAACAARLGMAAPPWLLSFAAGSAAGVEPDGRLRLSWRLIHLAPEEIERVLLKHLTPLKERAEMPDLWGPSRAAPVPA